MTYRILYKPTEYKRRWLWWNKGKYNNKQGTIVKIKSEAIKRVRSLNKTWRDDFKFKKVR